MAMFKKHLEVKPSSNIKSSEKRKLQENVQHQTQALPVPGKLSKAIFNSTEVKKGTLYFDSTTKDPLFFQLRDGKEFIPTLHELWLSIKKNEPLGVPYILTHDYVIDRLINGADLMIRGCHDPYVSGLKKNAIVAVVNYKSPNIAVAVGRCLMDLEGKDDDKVPESGVAVDIYTVVGDQLASLGRSMDEILKEVEERNDAIDETEKTEPGRHEETEESQIEEENKDNVETVTETFEATTLNDETGENNKENLEEEEEIIEDEFEDDDEYLSEPEEYVMATEDIDDMFRRAVFYTLSQDKLEFPILASQFMSAHVLLNLPPVDTNVVNMKKTSWKKTTKFLKAMEKENLIKTKGKDDKLSIISGAPRSDSRISEFVPYRIRGKCEASTPHNAEPLTDHSVVAPMIIKSYLKPTNDSRMMFNRLDAVFDEYYTEQEVKALVQKYIKLHPHMVYKSNPEYIEPDDILQTFDKSKRIKRSELAMKVAASFTPYYVMYKEGDGESNDVLVKKRLVPKRGKVPRITLTVESVKVGRRVVTRVAGLEPFYVDLERFADVLRVQCGGSCTVGDDARLGRVVSVQGKHDGRVIAILERDWGVPSKCCDVDVKVKFRKRR